MTTPAPLVRGYRGEIRDVAALVARLRTLAGDVLVLRADRVHGADHLRLAARLATRAIAEGRARTSDVATETMLYASGDRQIGRAIAFAGLTPETRAIAAVAWDEAQLDALATEHAWTRDDSVLAGSDETLDAFGITQAERDMIPPERWGDLVLERVALLDVAKS